MPTDQDKEIFFEALELEGAVREDFLEEACGGDGRRRARIETLLAAHGHAGGFLSEPTAVHDGAGRIGPRVDPADTEAPGTQIGRYTLVETIGEGGFGKVWLAAQTEPVARHVALKILKPGMDSGQVVTRFQQERQALALMNHDGITRILDAGSTPTGRPYVVMEYVDGEPVTDWCGSRDLPVRRRLEIFERICLAVQHAHQRGVIHRDLKPTNVLVATDDDDDPVPKVIDFGIAKATERRLTDRTLQTTVRIVLGTPQYMSPEQADLGPVDIDTRSDVYSLGAMLHELLVGVTPIDPEDVKLASFSEIQRQIREVVPPRPSVRARRRGADPSVVRQLRGDLDWIILKAIEKDRTRRYPSAAGLAADVRRHLNDEPVVARPPGVWYLISKLARRHRVAAASFVLVAATLVASLLFATASVRSVEARLWEAYLAQAQALRTSDRPGRRFDALAAIGRAAEIRPSRELRDEAIACLTLPDVRRALVLPDRPHATAAGLRVIDRFAYTPSPGRIVVTTLEGFGIMDVTDDARPVVPLTFSPDGRRLAVRSEGDDGSSLTVWNVESSERLLQLGPDRGYDRNAVAFDAAGDTPSWVAVAEPDGHVYVYDLVGDGVHATVPIGPGPVALAADPSKPALAVAARDERTITFVDVAGDETATLSTPFGVASLAFSEDGRLVAGGDDGRVGLIIVETAEMLTTFAGHRGAVTHVACDTDDGLLASADDATVRLWSIDGHEPMPGAFRAARLAGLGNGLLTASGDGVTRWQFEAPLSAVGRKPEPPSERVTVDASGAARLADESGRHVATFRDPDGIPFTTAGLSADTLSATAANGVTRRWNLDAIREHLRDLDLDW